MRAWICAVGALTLSSLGCDAYDRRAYARLIDGRSGDGNSIDTSDRTDGGEDVSTQTDALDSGASDAVSAGDAEFQPDVQDADSMNGQNILINASFEGLGGYWLFPWTFNTKANAQTMIAQDSANKVHGNYSVRVEVTRASGDPWDAELN